MSAGVLYGKESLGYIDVKKNGGDQRGHGNEQRRGAVTQNELQCAPVKINDRLKTTFRSSIKPALLAFFLVPEQLRRHHRRQCQRHKGRNDDGNRQRNRKFAEQSPHDIAHEQQRYQHRNQRNRQ